MKWCALTNNQCTGDYCNFFDEKLGYCTIVKTMKELSIAIPTFMSIMDSITSQHYENQLAINIRKQ